MLGGTAAAVRSRFGKAPVTAAAARPTPGRREAATEAGYN